MNDVTRFDPETGELPATTGMAQSLVGQLVKAEIDQQITTAHAYPRLVSKVMNSVLSLVTISPAAAEKCGYALPRGKKPILGPSIRLAEIVASQWGNCRIGARVVHVDRFEKYVEAEGVFHDLETNTATTARVRRRIVDSNGRLYNDDMIVVTGNAACSIAKRNAILAGVPAPIWSEAYEVAMKTVKGDVKTLPERRAKAFQVFAAFGIKPEQIYAALEIGGEEDIGLDEIATLTAMHAAIKGGDQKVEDYFPDMGKRKSDDEATKGTAAKLADIAKPKGAGKSDADAKDEPATEGAREKAAQDRHDADRAEAQKQHQEDIAQRAAETQAEGDANLEPEVTDEQAAAARKHGYDARLAGRKQSACPQEFRVAQRLFDAWIDGWSQADEDRKKNAEGGGEA
jgi:ribosome modulation factor